MLHNGTVIVIKLYVEKDKHILIVDRDTSFADELTNFLLAAGYRNIESLDNYKGALVRVKQNSFDVVLMDIFNPEMKGLEYAEKIRFLKPKIKIFLLIEPEHHALINNELLREFKFKCVFKFLIKENLLELFR